MTNMKRLFVTAAAIGGLMALTTNTRAIEPGYGPDAPSRESVSETNKYYEARGSAAGGEMDRGSGCSRRGPSATGTGTGGSMDADTGTGGARGTGAGGTVDPATGIERPGNGH